MSKKIYVGNLPYSTTDEEVRRLFSKYGAVESVDLITDRETGRPRGFGFVEMTSGAEAAIEDLNLKDIENPNLKEDGGRLLNVNEVKPSRAAAGRSGSRW